MRKAWIVAVLLMLASAGLAANVWNTKTFTAWTDRDLEKVMTDSPWAGKASITHTRPGGGQPAIEWKLTVTWRSGLPIKQGIIREQIGLNGQVPQELAGILSQEEEVYVIGVEGLPGMYASDRQIEGILKSVRLERGGGKAPIVALGAKGVMFDAEGKPMEPPAPGRGGGFGGGVGGGGRGGPQTTAMVIFFFPKTDAITEADREVEFTSVIGSYNVKRKFRLRDMTVNGQLAL